MAYFRLASSPYNLALHFRDSLIKLENNIRGSSEFVEAEQYLEKLEHMAERLAEAIAKVDDGPPNGWQRMLEVMRLQLTQLEKLLAGQTMLFASRIVARHVKADNASVLKELWSILDVELPEAFEKQLNAPRYAPKAEPAKPKPAPRAPSGPKPSKTFAQAQLELLNLLEKKGWTVAKGLKIPHATFSQGLYRLWFKPQAIYASYGKDFKDFGKARSLYAEDIRFSDLEKLESALYKAADTTVKKWKAANP